MASETKKPLTGSQRVKRSTDRYKAAGLIHAKVWVHPDEVGKVRNYAKKQPKTKEVFKTL